MSGTGDSTSPGGIHHALQAPCDCILSDFPDGSDELQQVAVQSLVICRTPA